MFLNLKTLLSIFVGILFYLVLPSWGQFTLNDIGILQIAGDKQYFIDRTARFNWYRSVQICASLNMTLASIESATEQRELKNLLFLKSSMSNLYWLSGNDLAKSREFSWFGTGQLFSYTSWAVAPGGNTAQRCVRTDANFNWVRDSCSNLRYFICERPVVPKCGIKTTCISNPTIIF